MSLHAGDVIVQLSHTADDSCIAREPIDLVPQHAQIVAEIDEMRHVRRVYLPQGMSHRNQRTSIQEVSSVEN